MQVVRVIIFLVILIATSCSKNWHSDRNIDQETSQVTRGKAKSGRAIIVGNCYDFSSTTDPIPAGIVINGVVLETSDVSFKCNVWPGEYEIRAGFPGKKWASRSVKIEKGDSINIKFYLKDDDTPLHEK